MQKRHTNRERYFEEQAQTTRNYYIPYIKEYTGNLPNKVLEVGCGEGGNLLPFAELGCDVIGIDIAASRIEQAQNFFITKRQKGTFIASDIFLLKDLQKHFPLILIHDVIEHIDNKEQFLRNLKKYLSPNGMIFIAFPAWQMPFGGHQQIARSKIISHMPFIHLLPRILYKWILELFSEQESTVKELLTIKYTRCTIEMFRRVVKQTDYQIVNEQLYFINPHYKIKFGLTPHKLNKTIACIPFIRNVFSTSCFYLIIYINIQEVINKLTIKDKQHRQSYKAHKSHILFFIEQYFSKTIKGLR